MTDKDEHARLAIEPPPLAPSPSDPSEVPDTDPSEDEPTPIEIPLAEPKEAEEKEEEKQQNPSWAEARPDPEVAARPPAPEVISPAQPPLITNEPPASCERAPILAPEPPKRNFPWMRALQKALIAVLAILVVGPPMAVLAYKVLPPPITWLMIERLLQGRGLHKHWVRLDDIDPSLPNAVIAAEDQRFCEHHGFDFEAMQAAIRANERHPGKLRGGSTISQQTAKNVFLWPGRDYLRKGLEAYFTVLIETLWGKRRIMEVYLNVVEWGPGTYGAESAARRYFDEPAADIDPGEASHLAAILPSPLKWKAVNPGRYVQKRSRHIDAAASAVRRDGLAKCLQ